MSVLIDFFLKKKIKQPQIALAVVIEHGGSASKVAREVMDTYFKLTHQIQ